MTCVIAMGGWSGLPRPRLHRYKSSSGYAAFPASTTVSVTLGGLARTGKTLESNSLPSHRHLPQAAAARLSSPAAGVIMAHVVAPGCQHFLQAAATDMTRSVTARCLPAYQLSLLPVGHRFVHSAASSSTAIFSPTVTDTFHLDSGEKERREVDKATVYRKKLQLVERREFHRDRASPVGCGGLKKVLSARVTT